jgi:ABC-type transport system involved in cytochrome bd biosynthesis fused ATPase/permease subunit
MCLPAAAIVGIATGLMGAVQSIAGYQAQSQAASASEKAYQEQRNLNQEAANRAYQQTQLKMKGEMEKASQQAEQGLQKTANIQAASQRVAKPSAGGLVLGLAGSALSGVQAGMALKAPPGKIGTSTQNLQQYAPLTP